MYDINMGAGTVVAADTQQSVATLDAAVISQSRMCANIVEAARQSQLPIGATQSLLGSLASGLADLVASRANLAKAVCELTVIQRRSTLRETSFGCPGGGSTPDSAFFIGARKTTENAA